MGTEESRHRWEDVKELLNRTCARRLIIWGSDANGQLCNMDHEEDGKYAKREHDGREIIGPRHKSRQEGEWEGMDQLHRICRRQQAIPKNIEKSEVRKTGYMGTAARRRNKGRLGKGGPMKYAATWNTADGNIRQIGYIAINAKGGNATRNPQSHIYWRSNMYQNQKRRVRKCRSTTTHPGNINSRYQPTRATG